MKGQTNRRKEFVGMTPLRKRMMEELQLRNLYPMTANTYIHLVERFARYFNQSPARLGPEQVRQYLLHLIQEKKVVASTLLVNRSALRFLYVGILKQKWFDEEIACPKRRPTLPGMLSRSEMTRILDHTHNLKHWTILATFYATALRCDELRHLKVSDIDRERMAIHVRRGKGGIPRDIGLSPVLLERLNVYFAWRKPTDWLFPSKQCPDRPLDDSGLRNGVPRGRETSRHWAPGISPSVPARLRHAHARRRSRSAHHPGPARPLQHSDHGALSARVAAASAGPAPSLRLA